ncbi:TonB-dependent receptor [Chitinophaga horti]|uniref:TonB-dependent receptor n=1 Tax=Chitinophaga horti TaxID=2920382 RepID=A0ABY6IZQ7_9BACT|nr:TonB-dependent receptor [Chitinophaga horti]UYQ91882.1 TonB-dependent receptor [Chitinophaga horti]
MHLNVTTKQVVCTLLFFLLFHFTGYAGQSALRQAVPVKGRIIDVDGTPLVGVTVRVKDASTGTVTGADGTFTLNVPDANATLSITYLGYNPQEIPLAGKTELNVTLQPSSSQLEQVVVVGYGTQRKRDLTGSVANVQGRELAKQPVLTATQGVQGKVAGVQIIANGAPGSQPLVRIRGTGSMLAGSEPLYVVDGVFTNDIRNISTNDIVSMDVLKDAAAAAIYGVRAANGVIIITTKKGRSGKMEVSYSGNVGFRQASNLVKMANRGEYTAFLQDVAPGTTIPTGNADTDWFDDVLRNALQHNHNVSVSGGSEKATYYFNLGYLSDEGIVIGNKYDRFTIRSNNEFNLTKQLKFGTQLSFMRANSDTIDNSAIFNNAYRAAPVVASKQGGRYGNTSAFGNVGNPILNIDKVNNRGAETRLQGTGYLEYSPIKSLKLRSAFSVDQSFYNRRVYNYAYLNDEVTFLETGGNQRNELSTLTGRKENATNWLWDNTATYEELFGKHRVSVLAGFTSQKFSSDFIEGVRRGVPPTRDQWYLATGDPNTSTNNGGGDKYTRASVLGRINYAYADKYLLSGSLRRDASSRFPEANRVGWFPAAGVAWVLSEEGFLKDQQDVLDFLKLRASWGRIGNDNIASNQYIVTANLGVPYVFNGNITLGSAISDIKNANLVWETTEEYDFGLEFSTLNRRLTGEINYYDKRTIDALVIVRLPGILGDPDNEFVTNAGSFTNKGWEFTAGWKDDITEDFNYSIGGNITFNKNKVVGLNAGQPLPRGGVGQQGSTTLTANGQPIGSFYVYRTDGIFQTQEEIDNYQNKDGVVIQPNAQPGDLKYLDKDGDGSITAQDRYFVGSYQPKMYYGINAGLNYKSLDFSADFYGNAGNKVYNGKKAFRYQATDNIEADYANNRWRADRPSNKDPRVLEANTPASDYFVESGTFFRLNNVTLGYTLPKTALDRLNITTLRFFLTSQNLFTLKRFSGFSPELPGGPLEAGIELSAYPTNRTYAFGVNATF